MSAAPFLATRLDNETALLDLNRAALILLDEWSAQVWQACAGRTLDELCASLQGSRRRLRRTLRDLEAAGLVRHEDAGWTRAPAQHV